LKFLLITGKRITERQCKEKTRILNKQILPILGCFPISEVDRVKIKKFRNDLYLSGLSGSTVNKALSCLKVILEYAEEKELIRGVPKIERASTQIKNPRGILNLEETKKLFSVKWSDYRAYVASMLAASTGLRMGEILAIKHNDIKNGYIEISKSWDHVSRMVKDGTKSGRSRTVIIPTLIQQELESLKYKNPHQGGGDRFIFFGDTMYAPLDGRSILKYFKRALYVSGISEEQRKERNITFHSFRHWFNSILINAKVPLLKVQQLTGHSTTEMSANYFHLDEMDDVREIQESLFIKS
jgi:integrase